MEAPILIVGGGNGLGAAIALQLLKRGLRVLVADKSFSAEIMAMVPADCQKVINLAQDDIAPLLTLDIGGLIVTAGIGRLDFFDSFTKEEIEKCFKVNTLPTIQLIRGYYLKLKGKDSFPAAVMTSITGQIASPLYGVYSATKGALTRFIEAINGELAYHETSNRILDVAPGRITGTQFHSSETHPSAVEKEVLSCLASNIIEKALAHESLYIPNYDTVYRSVLTRYHEDPIRFAHESLAYKLQQNILNPKPHITVGYLTGSFDLFHIGHLNLLRNAKKYCDKLVVGVHKDGSHKGKELYIPLEERIAILKSITYVDEVIVCSREDMDDWEKLRFDFLFVGSDYQGSERFSRYEVLAKPLNVKIVYLPYTQTTSSTQLRKAIS